MRRFFILGLVVFISFGVYSAPAHAGKMLEFFFPSLREEPDDPTETMIAPFAEGQGAEKKAKLDTLPVNSVSLEKPHLVSGEIGQWLMVVVGDAMNFEPGNAGEQIAARTKLFDVAGQNQYQEFLREKNILKVIQSERYRVRSYVEEAPLLLNEGLVAGRYRWLYQVPVVISYMDKSMKGYKDADPITQKGSLNVQIGRVRADDKPDGLQVEQWSGTVEAFDKQ